MPTVSEPALAELGDAAADRYARPLLLDQEGADALVPQGRVDGGENRHVVRDPAVGDPVLGPVQDIVVAVRRRAAADPGDVRAHGGLGGGEADEPGLTDETGEDLRLQRRVAAQPQRLHPEGVVEDGGRQPGAARRQFLGDEDVVDQPPALAPVFRRDVRVHDALLPGLAQQRQRRFVLRIRPPGDRQNLLQHERARPVADRDLFRRQLESEHGCASWALGECRANAGREERQPTALLYRIGPHGATPIRFPCPSSHGRVPLPWPSYTQSCS